MSTRVQQAPAATRARGYGASSSASSKYRREPVQYTVERVRGHDGKEQEVLTLEDTPEPGAAGAAPAAYAGGGYASTSGSRQDAYAGYQPPPAKKRKSDVGGGSYAAPSYAAQAQPYPSHHAPNYQNYQAPAAASGSGTKRKAADYDRDHRPAQKAKDLVSPYSDSEGHFIVKINGELTNTGNDCSYVIDKMLGQGTFGRVVAATEKPGGRRVALKIIRNVHKYQEAAKTEIKVLERLRANDRRGEKKCIRLDSAFDYYGHPCLVTPLLSCSVFDFLKENSYEPFPLSHVQQFAYQLLKSLQYVHQNKLIHTDLKPENILLEDGTSDLVPNSQKNGRARKILRNTGIQLIDFGSATFEPDYHATVVSTRHYRAPEIILNLGWSYPCDMWSIGCILVEFMTGEALFQTHENLEHLAMMERVFGPMPSDLARTAARTCTDAGKWLKKVPSGGSRRSTSNYALNFPLPETPKSSVKFVKGMRTLKDIIAKHAGDDIAATRFYELCEGLLRWDTNKRTRVDDALNHPFFKLNAIHDDGNPRR
ncbi:hypothetical protein JCM11641_000570 [Rhodosporidiobolus odoratus]